MSSFRGIKYTSGRTYFQRRSCHGLCSSMILQRRRRRRRRQQQQIGFITADMRSTILSWVHICGIEFHISYCSSIPMIPRHFLISLPDISALVFLHGQNYVESHGRRHTRMQGSRNTQKFTKANDNCIWGFNPLNPELNPICYLLALLGAHHFLHVSRIRVKLLTFRLLMSYIYGAPILDVSRSHTTTQHSR